jgi:hypothetical protein
MCLPYKSSPPSSVFAILTFISPLPGAVLAFYQKTL